MKGFKVRKLVAAAAGAALLGSALIPAVSALTLSKSQVYSASGAPAVSIVVGSRAAITDAVWAGNIAAALAQKATKTEQVTVSGTATGATASVTDLVAKLVVGGTVTLGAGSKQYKVALNSASGAKEVDANTLTDAQLTHLYNKSTTERVDNTTSTVTIIERVGVTTDARFDTGSNIKDLIATVNAGDFFYSVDMGAGLSMNAQSNGSGNTYFSDSGSDDVYKTVLFGDVYEINTIDFNSTTPYVKLVKASAKESYNLGDSITGLAGDGAYNNQPVSVKLASVVQSGPTATYQATFQLLDQSGNVVDTRTVASSTNLATTFVDSQSNYALKSNLFIDGIFVTAVSPTGYVEVTKGTDTVEMYDGKGYPYNANDTSGIYDYTVRLVGNATNATASINSNASTAGKFHGFKISNSRDVWNTGSTNGPLYPTTSGQSLQGKTGKTAVFGNALIAGTAGKGYATIEFAGFEAKEDKTLVVIGKTPGGAALDTRAIGGINYRGKDDADHTIPMALKLSRTTSGDTFLIDTKTVWYNMFGSVASAVTASASTLASPVNDSNIALGIGPTYFVNGRTWVLASTAAGVDITVDGYGTVEDLNVAETFTIDNVLFTVTYSETDGATPYMAFKTDMYAMFRKTNSTGTIFIPDESDTNTSSPTYGKFFLTNTDVNVYDSNIAGASNQGGNLRLEMNGDHDIRYAIKAKTQGASFFWLALDAQTLGEDETSVIQNNHTITFNGVSNSAGIEAEALAIDATYFLSDNSDWNSLFSTGDTKYVVANFGVNDATTTTYTPDFNVFIDTGDGGSLGPFPNSNLAAFSRDVQQTGAVSVDLTSGSLSNYLQAAWTDSGAKFWLDTTTDVAKISMPKATENVLINVLGTNVTRTSTGETLTVAEGQTGETAAGAKITVDDITYNATVTGDVTGVTVTPTSYMSPVSFPVPIVFTDASPPAGTHIIIGGPVVNRLAAAVPGISLRKPGDGAQAFVASSGDIVVAGYTATDTGAAAQDLINALNALS